MHVEPLTLDTCKPSEGMGLNGPGQNESLNHLMKMPTFGTLFRAMDLDDEICVHDFDLEL